MTKPDRFIALGVITGTHGVKGAVKIKPFTSEIDGIFAYDSLQDAAGNAVKMKCIGEAKNQLICQVSGVRYRDEADKLKGTEIGVMRSALPDTDSDEFYIEDLVGMSVKLEDGTDYGTVKAIHNFGAGDVVEIIRDGAPTEMLPFNEQYVPDINLTTSQITVALPIVIGKD